MTRSTQGWPFFSWPNGEEYKSALLVRQRGHWSGAGRPRCARLLARRTGIAFAEDCHHVVLRPVCDGVDDGQQKARSCCLSARRRGRADLQGDDFKVRRRLRDHRHAALATAGTPLPTTNCPPSTDSVANGRSCPAATEQRGVQVQQNRGDLAVGAEGQQQRRRSAGPRPPGKPARRDTQRHRAVLTAPPSAWGESPPVATLPEETKAITQYTRQVPRRRWSRPDPWVVGSTPFSGDSHRPNIIGRFGTTSNTAGEPVPSCRCGRGNKYLRGRRFKKKPPRLPDRAHRRDSGTAILPVRPPGRGVLRWGAGFFLFAACAARRCRGAACAPSSRLGTTRHGRAWSASCLAVLRRDLGDRFEGLFDVRELIDSTVWSVRPFADPDRASALIFTAGLTVGM